MRYWIDYKASIVIEAEDEKEAEAIFHQVYEDETRIFAQVERILEEDDE